MATGAGGISAREARMAAARSGSSSSICFEGISAGAAVLVEGVEERGGWEGLKP